MHAADPKVSEFVGLGGRSFYERDEPRNKKNSGYSSGEVEEEGNGFGWCRGCVKEFVLGFSKFVTRTFEFRVVSPIVFCDGVPDTGLFALPFSSCFFSGFDNGTAVKQLWW